ncbi:MAG: D-amino-acid dehydrogenase [Pseudonocardiales bacterium]|nr:D-amino-acid dehydrogenase [Pseudonocardiales bacterium]
MLTDHPTSDVVVVGAGIVGALIGRELAGQGRRVVLVDPDPGGGASVANAGMLVPSYCRPMAAPATLRAGMRGLIGRDASVTLGSFAPSVLGWLARFAWAARPGRARQVAARLVDSARTAADGYAELAAETGVALGLRRSGWLQVAGSAAVLRQQIDAAREQKDMPFDILDNHACRRREPGLGPHVAGGVHFDGDASLDPVAATRAALMAAEHRGAVIHRALMTGLAVRDGRVRAVRTTAGDVSATTFVLATGAAPASGTQVQPGWGWSIDLPTVTTLVHAPLMGLDDHVVFNPLAERIRITGGMRIGGTPSTEHDRVAAAAIRHAAERLVPGLRDLRNATVLRGARPMTPDGVPRIAWTRPNLITATGHGTLGMTLAPSTAKAVSALLRAQARAPRR